MTILDCIDILLIAYAIYSIYNVIRNTRAEALLKGILILMVATLASNWLGLHAVSWTLQKLIAMVAVALPVVFQPELRRALEQLGQGKMFRGGVILDVEQSNQLVDELTRTVGRLSRSRTGALLVIEREVGLNEYAETGVAVDGLVSSELLLNIFFANSPLHDGAVIIRGNRIAAAGCLLPLTEARALSSELGTRHRAAIGMSEQCDALVLVVSEETGKISVARGGHLQRDYTLDSLDAYLRSLLVKKGRPLSSYLKWGKKQ
ncbi:MAG: diadenylate cyclase CdaA [Negativicutes bacterium]|nr:diadenylate cyclase CdaA [Negativicutes bacterium]